MSVFNKIVKRFFSKPETDPRQAYNLWASCYDNQPGNLMLDLDESLFAELITGIDIAGRQVADIGCGTGRHWAKIIARAPQRLLGYDVSEEMLKKLKQKFPYTETHLLKNDLLQGLEDQSCDLVFSTLTIAHIKNADTAIQEWVRVLKQGGDLIITDYHPATLEKGGQRTFTHNGQVIAVKNHIHPIHKIRETGRQLGLTETRFVEKIIDDNVKPYYEKKDALDVYEKYKGAPVIYGIHFKK